MSTSLIQVRVDDELKNQAASVYEALGLDLSTAIRMFLKRSIMVNGVPFQMTLPERESPNQRAVRALYQLGEAAERNGTAGMSLEEINAEINAVRRARGEPS